MSRNNTFRSNHDGPNGAHIGIPQNLINNFNPYVVLEPQRVNINSSSSSAEISLIDLDDPIEGSSGVQGKKSQEDNVGFDLIDVFQNIYVSPEHVNKSKKEDKTEVNIDYEDFFRKLEAGKKITGNNSPIHEVKKENMQYQSDLDRTFDKTAKNIRSNHTNINNSTIYIDESRAPENDELIEELYTNYVLNKNLEKAVTPDASNGQHVRVLRAPVLQNNPRNLDEDTKYINNILKDNKTLSFDALMVNRPNSPEQKSASNNLVRDIPWKLSPETCQAISTGSNLNDTIPMVRPPTLRNAASNYSNISDNEDIKYINNITTEYIPSFKENIINTPVSRDRILKSIPNTLLRDIPNSQQNTDVRDSTSRSSKLNNDLVMDFLKAMGCEDINLKRDSPNSISATNSKTSLPSSKLTKNNEIDLSHLKTAVKKIKQNNTPFYADTLSLMNTTVDPELILTMPVKPVIKDAKLYNKNRLVKSESEKLHYTKGPGLNEKTIVLPQILKRMSLQKKELDEKKNVQKRLILDEKGVEIPVKFEPVVLMEDCNKERLKALKTRQMLDEFVRNSCNH